MFRKGEIVLASFISSICKIWKINLCMALEMIALTDVIHEQEIHMYIHTSILKSIVVIVCIPVTLCYQFLFLRLGLVTAKMFPCLLTPPTYV